LIKKLTLDTKSFEIINKKINEIIDFIEDMQEDMDAWVRMERG
jgi:hypothetical protein